MILSFDMSLTGMIGNISLPVVVNRDGSDNNAPDEWNGLPILFNDNDRGLKVQ